MTVIVGYIIILASVIGGFILAGGHVASLIQPTEVIMIGGAAAGAFVVTNTGKVIKATLGALPTVFKGSKFTKALYLELLSLLYDILAKVRKEGLMSIESDVESPEQSPIFSKYPMIVSDHHAMEFMTDYLRIMVGGNLNAFEIENLMDVEIETHHHEGEAPAQAVARLGDGLPAFGIVAAVMGVVHTMESVGLPPAELGKLDIKLEVDADGKTGITVTADNKNTLDLLQRDSRGLERALADAGLKADSGSLSFNLRSDGQERNQEQAQAALNYKQSIPEEEPLALDLLNRSYVVNLAEGLDIKI